MFISVTTGSSSNYFKIRFTASGRIISRPKELSRGSDSDRSSHCCLAEENRLRLLDLGLVELLFYLFFFKSTL